MHLHGTYVFVRVSSSNEYHFMTWLLRVSFLSTWLFSVPRGEEIISSHGTFTVRPFPFPGRREKAIKNSLWVMADKQPENGVSPPMGAWERRSNKIIRKYVRQLSCVFCVFCKVYPTMSQCLTFLVSRGPGPCCRLTPHSIDVFQLESASNPCHVILPQKGVFLKNLRKIKKNVSNIVTELRKWKSHILFYPLLFFPSLLPSFIPIICGYVTHIPHFVIL